MAMHGGVSGKKRAFVAGVMRKNQICPLFRKISLSPDVNASAPLGVYIHWTYAS
jgi:hypothetical protein